MVKQINAIEEFDQAIQGDRVLVDMFAIWCGPCSMLSPIVEQFSEENKEITVIKVDVDQLQEVAIRYNVMSIPTLLYIEKGQVIDSSLGYVQMSAIKNLCKIN